MKFLHPGGGGRFTNLVISEDSCCYKLLKSLVTIGYQQICHWCVIFHWKRALWKRSLIYRVYSSRSILNMCGLLMMKYPGESFQTCSNWKIRKISDVQQHTVMPTIKNRENFSVVVDHTRNTENGRTERSRIRWSANKTRRSRIEMQATYIQPFLHLENVIKALIVRYVQSKGFFYHSKGASLGAFEWGGEAVSDHICLKFEGRINVSIYM